MFSEGDLVYRAYQAGNPGIVIATGTPPKLWIPAFNIWAPTCQVKWLNGSTSTENVNSLKSYSKLVKKTRGKMERHEERLLQLENMKKENG